VASVHNAWHFPPNRRICLNVPLGQSSWFCALIRVAAIFRFLLQGFHNWTLNPFHMMGLRVCWCAFIHGATVENTLFEDGDASNTFRAFNPASGRNLLDGHCQPLLVTDFWDRLFQQALAALLHAVCARHRLVDECGWCCRFSPEPARLRLR